jgi:hypothetical protein
VCFGSSCESGFNIPRLKNVGVRVARGRRFKCGPGDAPEGASSVLHSHPVSVCQQLRLRRTPSMWPDECGVCRARPMNFRGMVVQHCLVRSAWEVTSSLCVVKIKCPEESNKLPRATYPTTKRIPQEQQSYAVGHSQFCPTNV